MNCKIILTAMVALGAGCSAGGSLQRGGVSGLETDFGKGKVSTFASVDKSGRPLAIGVSISPDALVSPPTELTDGLRCSDKNGDTQIDKDAECVPTHEKVLPLPDIVATRSDIPFKWVLFNWNPMGHEPPGIYSLPHFDIHYMIQPIEVIYNIAAGSCGADGVRCDQYERAKKPLPAGFMHPDFQDVDAVVPGMGNHLIDMTSHEFHGSTFDRTWIYGAYDGRVAFFEEMVSRKYLMTKPDQCFPIKAVSQVELGGWYPTQSCMRFEADRNRYTVSMEGFELRAAPDGAKKRPS